MLNPTDQTQETNVKRVHEIKANTETDKNILEPRRYKTNDKKNSIPIRQRSKMVAARKRRNILTKLNLKYKNQNQFQM